MEPGGGPGKRAEEATVTVPAQGGGPPPESKEPQQQPGPNPELDDKTKDDLVSGCVHRRGRAGARQTARRTCGIRSELVGPPPRAAATSRRHPWFRVCAQARRIPRGDR